MDYNVSIDSITVGQQLEGFYVLSEAAVKVTAAGKPFLSAMISDRTGKLPAMVWDYAGPIGAADVGRVVKLRGEVSAYRGSLQITVDKLRLAREDDPYDSASLVPTAPIDQDAALHEIETLIDTIADDDYRRVARTLLTRDLDVFVRIPAAKSVHHAFLHGLLMHTAYMLRIADFLSGLYAEVVDRSLRLCGTLLHVVQKRD